MIGQLLVEKSHRKTIVTGHYGSGKTEFSVSLAILLSEKLKSYTETAAKDTMTEDNIIGLPYRRLALIDLDIVNPYFRSREHRDLLKKSDIDVYGSMYETEITAELPALGATIRKPLEDKNCRVIVDLGGNDTGALVLNQFSKYFSEDDFEMLVVINANRPETTTVKDTLAHILKIQQATALKVSKIVNNTHLLRDTTSQDVIKGNKLCKEVSKELSIPILCNCYPAKNIDPATLDTLPECLMPLGLYLRPTWLDIN